MSSLVSCLQVRSQLTEQLLEYLEKVQDYADTRLMPGRDERMPSYFEDASIRTPRGVYQWPDVIKRVRRERLPDTQQPGGEKPSEDESFGARNSKIDEASEIGQLNEDLESKRRKRFNEGTDPKRVAWLDEVRRAMRKQKYRALIEGSAGQGKSWLTQHTAARQAAEAYEALKFRTALPDDLILPVTLRISALITGCETLHGDEDARTQQVRDAARSILVDEGCKPHAAEFLAQRIGTQQVWLYLDALDESSKGGKLDAVLAAIDNWHGPIVVTTRPYASDHVSGHTSWNQHPGYRLARFTVKQSLVFVAEWFKMVPGGGALADRLSGRVRRGECRKVAEKPLLLTLLCAAAQNKRLLDLKNPTRGQIYEAIFADIFAQIPEPDKTDAHAVVKYSYVRPLLEELAWRMTCSDTDNPILPEDRLLDLIDAWTERKGLKQKYSRGTLLETFKKARILVPEDGTDQSPLVFRHREFGTYLAGAYLASQINEHGWKGKPTITVANPDDEYRVFDWLCMKIWDPVAEPIVGFALGAMDNPMPLLEALEPVSVITPEGKELGDDVLGYRLGALARCLINIAVQKRDVRTHHALLAFLDRVTSRIIGEITTPHSSLLHIAQEGYLEPLVICAVRHDGFEVLNSLAVLIDHEDGLAHQASARALIAMAEAGADVSKHIHQLTLLLDNKNWRGRQTAGQALHKMIASSAGEPDVWLWLNGLLEHEESTRRCVAAKAFGEMAKSGVDISEALDWPTALLAHEDWEVREATAKTLGSMTWSVADMPIVLDHLVVLLEDSVHRVSQGALEAMKTMDWSGADVSNVLERLNPLLEHHNVDLCRALGGILGEAAGAGVDISIAMNKLAVLLGHKEWRVQWVAVETLASIAGTGADISVLLEQLIVLLEEGEVPVRESTAKTLAKMAQSGVDISETLEHLTALLEEKRRWANRAAAKALGYAAAMGADVSPALQRLVSLLRDEDREERREAVFALERMAESGADVSGALKDMIDLLGDKDPGGILVASAVGAAVGASATFPEAIAQLDVLLANEDKWIRAYAARALGAMVNKRINLTEVVCRLATLLEDREGVVCELAAESMGIALARGADVSGVLDRLAMLMGHEDSEVCLAALAAIFAAADTGADISKLLDSLIALLDDEDGRVRWRAVKGVQAAMRSGLDVSGSLGKLEVLRQDSEWLVSRQANYALKACEKNNWRLLKRDDEFISISTVGFTGMLIPTES